MSREDWAIVAGRIATNEGPAPVASAAQRVRGGAWRRPPCVFATDLRQPLCRRGWHRSARWRAERVEFAVIGPILLASAAG